MRKRTILLCILLTLSSVLVFCAGCSKKDEEDTQSKDGSGIYYTNKSCTKLIRKDKDIDVQMNSQLGAEELLDEMSKVGRNSKYRTAIPEDINISNVMVSNNIAYVDFSVGYKKIEPNEDVICKAAIVYTLTQLKGVGYVEFTVSGRPIIDTDGKLIGGLNRDSFLFGELPME